MRSTQSQIVQVQSQIVQTLYMSTAISNCPDTLCEHRNLNLSRHFMWAPQSQTVQVQSQIVQVQSQIVKTLYEGTATSNCPDSSSTTISNCPDTMRALQSQIDETLYDSTAILNCPDTLCERCNFKLFRYSMRAPQSQIIQTLYESTTISNCSDILWEHCNLKLSRHSMRAPQSHIVQTLYESTTISHCPDTIRPHQSQIVHTLREHCNPKLSRHSMRASQSQCSWTFSYCAWFWQFDGELSKLKDFQALWRSVETLHTAVLGNHTLTSGDNLLMLRFSPVVCVCL